MLPLDGLFSQQGEVFFKVANTNVSFNLSVTIPKSYDHAPYNGCHQRLNATTRYIEVAPKSTTGWIEVGGLLDTFNHGSWQLTCGSVAPWRVQPNTTLCHAQTNRHAHEKRAAIIFGCAFFSRGFVSSSTRTPCWGVRADERTKSNCPPLK